MGKVRIVRTKTTLAAGAAEDVIVAIANGSTIKQYCCYAGSDTDCPPQFIRVSLRDDNTGYTIHLKPLFIRGYNQSLGTSESVDIPVPFSNVTMYFKARNYSASTVEQNFVVHFVEAEK